MSGGPRVLAIDTAAPVVGAAVGRLGAGGVAVEGAWSQRCVRGADAALLPALQGLLGDLGAPLDGVVVAVGPGAFTGLRVGVAAALGLALARRAPVVPASALAARAALVAAPRVLALLDARKGRVYAGLYDTTGAAPVALAAERDCVLSAALPAPPFVAVGEGALTFRDAIVAAGGVVAEQADAAPAVALLRWFEPGRALDAGEVALRYLRDADAIRPADLGQRVGHPTGAHAVVPAPG